MTDEAIRRFLEALFDLGGSGHYVDEIKVGAEIFGDDPDVVALSAHPVAMEAKKHGLIVRGTNGEVMLTQDGLRVLGK